MKGLSGVGSRRGRGILKVRGGRGGGWESKRGWGILGVKGGRVIVRVRGGTGDEQQGRGRVRLMGEGERQGKSLNG